MTSTGQVTIRWIERKLNEFVNKALGTEGHDYVIASDIWFYLSPSWSSRYSRFRRRCTCTTSCTGSEWVLWEQSWTLHPEVLQGTVWLPELLRGNPRDEEGISQRKESGQLRSVTSSTCGITRVFVMTNLNSRWWESRQVKSSTPAPCRAYIKQALKIIMEGTEQELIEFIEEKRLEFSSLPAWTDLFPTFCLQHHQIHQSRDHLREGDTTPHPWVCDVQSLLTWEETNPQI